MKIKDVELTIIKGDLTQLAVDAVVNPANVNLTMRQGLAKVIKEKGGESIEQEALAQAPILPGQAVCTKAGKLKARYVIHTAVMGNDPGVKGRPPGAPPARGMKPRAGTALTYLNKISGEVRTAPSSPEIILRKDGAASDTPGLPGASFAVKEAELRQACRAALKLAEELKIRSLAFPALGCGQGGFPEVGSAKIMAQEILKFSKEKKTRVKEIMICLLDQKLYETFSTTVRGYVDHIQDTLGMGPYLTVDAIIEFGDGIIVIQRSNPPFGWALPGGFVDYGETLEQAAKREAKEETGLDLLGLRQFHAYSDPDRDPRFHTVATVFIAQGKGVPRSGDDAKDLKVVRYEDLLKMDYAFDHKAIIGDYLKQKKPNSLGKEKGV